MRRAPRLKRPKRRGLALFSICYESLSRYSDDEEAKEVKEEEMVQAMPDRGIVPDVPANRYLYRRSTVR